MTYQQQNRFKLIAAFIAIYFVWGTTYLAIRYAVETIPPLLMMSMRSLIAGAVLYMWGRLRGDAFECSKPFSIIQLISVAQT